MAHRKNPTQKEDFEEADQSLREEHEAVENRGLVAAAEALAVGIVGLGAAGSTPGAIASGAAALGSAAGAAKAKHSLKQSRDKIARTLPHIRKAKEKNAKLQEKRGK